tara:strand:- start:1303 stop:1521 length:219 start_codon:yes stop_codon:yes gene_type:complete
MESRKEFINRMQWMVLEIKESKLDDINILSMIEFQLMQREKDIIKNFKYKIISESDVMKQGRNVLLNLLKDL